MHTHTAHTQNETLQTHANTAQFDLFVAAANVLQLFSGPWPQFAMLDHTGFQLVYYSHNLAKRHKS